MFLHRRIPCWPGNATEIYERLRVVENWSSGNGGARYGKDGDLDGPDHEHEQISMLALHLLQSALVHINTLLFQRVLERRG